MVAGASLLTLLGGVGGAVAHGMINSGDIANQSIRSVDIHEGGVGSSELRRDSVGWFGELNDHTRQKIRSLAGDDGAVGPQGPQGPPGPPGATGPAGPVPDYYIVVSERATGETAVASCDPGDMVVGGGGSAFDSTPPGFAALGRSAPNGYTSWAATAVDAEAPVEARAICADLTPEQR